ncbi:MAG: sulfurtransferase complex subunit TusB [Proteobacteria bacterium]|nr:sulfurtransferase complex subunit TusB [Pseudomonadota bacterium]
MLHTVNHSPFRSDSLGTCLRFLLPGDVLLLIEDGVYGAQDGTRFSQEIRTAMESNAVCVLEPDLRARGVSDLIDGVEKIDYDGFVGLVEEHQVVGWL